jgi:X-X-X-Leu-X-X-Gly heptad repeat protein
MSGADIAAQMRRLSDAVAELSSKYGEFHAGLAQYAAGVDTLAVSGGQLGDGVLTLAVGARDLHGGVAELADGMAQLNEETAKIPGTIDAQVDEITGAYGDPNAVPVSFASPNNANTRAVQFVLRTAKIALPPPPPAPIAAAAEKETNLWTRIRDLFTDSK